LYRAGAFVGTPIGRRVINSADGLAMSVTNLRKDLDAVLKPLGFVRHKLTWNRRSTEYVDVVDIQISKGADAATINVGVLNQAVHRTTWGEDVPPVVDEPSATVRRRVGQLVDGKEEWWSLGELPTVAMLEVLVRDHVLPFMEAMHSVEAMEQQLVTEGVDNKSYVVPKLYLAVLRSERGDRAAACDLLRALMSPVAPGKPDRVRDVARRAGCGQES
jgi:hypothetical protein